jgi:hypothetical protein
MKRGESWQEIEMELKMEVNMRVKRKDYRKKKNGDFMCIDLYKM